MMNKKFTVIAAAVLSASLLLGACGAATAENPAADTEAQTEIAETENVTESAEEVTETTEVAEVISGPEWYSTYQVTDSPLTGDFNGDGTMETAALVMSDAEEGGGECLFSLQLTDASGAVIASYEVTRTNPEWYTDFNMFVFAEEYEGTTYFCYQVSTDLNPYCLTYGVVHMDGSSLTKDLVLYERDYENGVGLYDCSELESMEYYYDEGIVLYDAQEHQDESTDVMYSEYEAALDQAVLPFGLSREKMLTHEGEEVPHNYILTAEGQQDIYVIYGGLQQ